jgi:hypothetical protein
MRITHRAQAALLTLVITAALVVLVMLLHPAWATPSGQPGPKADDNTIQFFLSTVLADLYIDRGMPTEARRVLQQNKKAYGAPDRDLVYAHLLGRAGGDAASASAALANVKDASVAERLLCDVLLGLSRRSESESVRKLQELQAAANTDPKKAVLLQYVQEIMAYLRAAASQKPAPEERQAQLESIRQRMSRAKILGSQVLAVQSHSNTFPADLTTVPGLGAEYAAKYLYRGPVIKRPDEPMAIEKSETSAEGTIVIYADGHAELMKDVGAAQRIRQQFFNK